VTRLGMLREVVARRLGTHESAADTNTVIADACRDAEEELIDRAIELELCNKPDKCAAKSAVLWELANELGDWRDRL
jgi:hypothetical protein